MPKSKSSSKTTKNHLNASGSKSSKSGTKTPRNNLRNNKKSHLKALQKQRFTQLLVLCLFVFLAIFTIIKRLNHYQTQLVTDQYYDDLAITNPDLLNTLKRQVGAHPEQLNDIVDNVTQALNFAAQVQNNGGFLKSRGVIEQQNRGWLERMGNRLSDIASFGGGDKMSGPRGPTIQVTDGGGLIPSSVNSDQTHDSRLPEKPVEQYKLINPYRDGPDTEWYSPETPDSFGISNPDDLQAIQYAENKAKSMKLPNPGFIFHNKLPKCGTTTMHNIITVLADWNNYTHLKVESAKVQFGNERALVDIVKQVDARPLILMKHHFWFDFRPFGMQQPTYINVLRNPITWFESRYYFTQNGWTRNPGDRKHDPMGDVGDMTIDECVDARKEVCTDVNWKYTRFFCGNNVVCKGKSSDEKRRALQLAKKRLIEDFYAVGILEQFNDTLRLFERMMPSYFNLDFEALGADFTQEAIKKTKTRNKIPMSEESRQFFMNGPLKYDMDLYHFGRALFNRQLASVGLQSSYTIKSEKRD